jgi:hypothetical protein
MQTSLSIYDLAAFSRPEPTPQPNRCNETVETWRSVGVIVNSVHNFYLAVPRHRLRGLQPPFGLRLVRVDAEVLIEERLVTRPWICNNVTLY